MQSARSHIMLQVAPGHAPMPSGLLSTQAVAHIQVRDVDIVTLYSASGYLTTGVETRTSVHCAPCAFIAPVSAATHGSRL